MKKITPIILLFSFALIISCVKRQDDEYAMINFIIGDVMKNGRTVQIGDLLAEKDVIKTGKNSFCDIRIGTSMIRVKEKSELVLSRLMHNSQVENTAMGLEMGKMLCKPKKLMKSDRFVVKTPTAVAAVRGTQFTVESDPEQTTRIKVFDGMLQVVKRVPELDTRVDEVLSLAPVLGEEQKVIITAKDAQEAQDSVQTAMAKEAGKGIGEEDMMAAIIASTKSDVVVARDDMEKFSVEDFVKDNKEMIEVKPKEPEVIEKIVETIKKEETKPEPIGRILITRFEIYFINDGKVIWEGQIVGEPVHQGDRVYIASGDSVFCATTDGPVLWRKIIVNEGKVEFKEGNLLLSVKGGTMTLNPENGEKL